MEKIILVNKPKGITSFDVIRILRKKLGIKKMGHAGTLDPLASGLMIIGIEEGTKELTNYIGLDKKYIAEILFGKETTTGDLEGEVIQEKSFDGLNENEVKNIVENFHGEFELEPPVYSAIKKDGKPLYKYARSGEEVEIQKRKMKVFSSRFISLKENILTIEFHVASGVYIRSLAVEIGKRLGYPATLNNLTRTQIGEYVLEKALEI